MRKLSQRHLTPKKLSKRAKKDGDKLISEMREAVKQDPNVIEKFKEYGIPLDDIDNVHIEFCELDVSAKTKDREIFLNEKMLEDDSEVTDPTHYVVHEMMHYLQQTTGNTLDSRQKKEEDYLDLPTEQEAFEVQVDFKEDHEGKEEAKKYVKQLLDHHDVDGKERKEKEDELLN